MLSHPPWCSEGETETAWNWKLLFLGSWAPQVTDPQISRWGHGLRGVRVAHRDPTASQPQHCGSQLPGQGSCTTIPPQGTHPSRDLPGGPCGCPVAALLFPWPARPFHQGLLFQPSQSLMRGPSLELTIGILKTFTLKVGVRKGKPCQHLLPKLLPPDTVTVIFICSCRDTPPPQRLKCHCQR